MYNLKQWYVLRRWRASNRGNCYAHLFIFAMIYLLVKIPGCGASLKLMNSVYENLRGCFSKEAPHRKEIEWLSSVDKPNFDMHLLLISHAQKKRVDESNILTLDYTRHSLIRQEDSIIYSLLERAQYCYNADTYDPDGLSTNAFRGSLVEFMAREAEKLQAQVISSMREREEKKTRVTMWQAF